jgi:hypothetical protein
MEKEIGYIYIYKLRDRQIERKRKIVGCAHNFCMTCNCRYDQRPML